MSNPSLAQNEAAILASKKILASPEYDDDDEAEGDDDDDDLATHGLRERLLPLSDFGSPSWWFRT